MDNVVRDEVARLYPNDVESDFEVDVQKDILAWAKNQPTGKFWSTRDQVVNEYWNERLN